MRGKWRRRVTRRSENVLRMVQPERPSRVKDGDGGMALRQWSTSETFPRGILDERRGEVKVLTEQSITPVLKCSPHYFHDTCYSHCTMTLHPS